MFCKHIRGHFIENVLQMDTKQIFNMSLKNILLKDEKRFSQRILSGRFAFRKRYKCVKDVLQKDKRQMFNWRTLK